LAIFGRLLLFVAVKPLLRSLLLILGLAIAQGPARGDDGPPVVKSGWNGYERLDFIVAGRACLLVRPAQAAPGNPWIWRTEFFGTEPQADLALLAKGWHVAYMNVKNLYGAPPAIALLGSFYAHLVANYGLAPRMVLEGFGRGGLFAFNFAVAHPNRVAALYLDAPVLDIRSWPGGKRTTTTAKEWSECLAAYGLTEETVGAFRGNPLDHVAIVARAHVPIIAVGGDADPEVPYAQNTAILEQRYRDYGGAIQVVLKPGGGHDPHSLPDPAPIVNFLLEHARP